jgi:serine/threonine protein kinase
MIMDQING